MDAADPNPPAAAPARTPSASLVPFRIFLASPNDVQVERNTIRDVVAEVGNEPLFCERLALRVVAWDNAMLRQELYDFIRRLDRDRLAAAATAAGPAAATSPSAGAAAARDAPSARQDALRERAAGLSILSWISISPGSDPPPPAALPPGVEPYPGLLAFKPEQAPVFFGRGAEIDQLLTLTSTTSCRCTR
jgi:hypothetical protein